MIYRHLGLKTNCVFILGNGGVEGRVVNKVDVSSDYFKQEIIG